MHKGMSMIIDRLDMIKAISELDSNDYIIASYMLEHWKDVCAKKMVDIIKKTGVSKSTLARFCKKIGYRSFTEVQYALYYEMNMTARLHLSKEYQISDANLRQILYRKQRIIVLGEVSTLVILLNYISLFRKVNYECILKLNGGSMPDFLVNNQINANDLIIYVSLHRSNLELQIDYTDGYIDLLFWARLHHIDFLYVGKMTSHHEMEQCFIPIQAETLSDCIYQLTQIFEGILLYLYQQGSERDDHSLLES